MGKDQHEEATATAEALDQVIREGRLSTVYQPIIEIRSRQVLGFEALTRCPPAYFAGPEDLFAAAAEVGRAGELGCRARELAIKECPDLTLFLNLYPNELEDEWLVRPDDPIFRHKRPLFLEIVESAPLKYFDQCHNILAELRNKGARLAIDDLGAGYSNLKYIAELEPDLVKLDRDLIEGVAVGTQQFRLVRALVRLCKEMGADVVAEGVETAEEFESVRLAGVDYCQGYLFARPEPASDAMRQRTY